MKIPASIPPIAFLVLATAVESAGDAVIRLALHAQQGPARLIQFAVGGVLLFGYGILLNLAPLDFGRVVGLYIATLFTVWQVINYAFFKTLPTAPIMAGGVLIIAGGLIITYWRT